MLKSAKEVLAESLKKMLEKKTLKSITVKDLVKDCGISRQAFYYHFNDIFELVEWIFVEEASKALADNRNIDNWQQGYCHVLKNMRDNKALVVNVYRSISREYLETFMYKVLHDVIYPVVEEQSAGMNVDVKHKEFIAHFYSLAVVAMGLDWVRGGMKEEPEDIAEQVAILVKGDFKKALRIYAK
ncbi:TetR family transcriptional regulator [Anaerocolumna sedimenticola]|uniref:TetR family transcriptional regulator n=1 Tax=Anaerocolumna sedimenticola TaxID=2696063 RepID=A0A6P1TQD9_9FIRM|nr:TetR/AcrR family transcriptional regulator C-terminal domain-containing protein [Anaerocolumna sedimenticola]QHQ61775.1 TetR family transcriptional regulator [Anaerocolumna sedimenticola]